MNKEKWWMRFVRPLLNQRGEVGDADDDKGGEDEDEFNPNLDEVIIEGLDDPPKEQEKKEDKPEKTDEKTEKEEKKEEPDKYKELEGKYNDLQKHVSNLNKALSEERREKKAAKQDEAPALSKTELKKLWDEHQGDPDMLFNISLYMAEQAAKGASKTTIDQSKIAENKKRGDEFLTKNFPDLYEEGTPLRAAVDKVKEEMGFADHPYGDFIGMATQTLMNLPTLLKTAYDNGKKEAKGGDDAEKARKDAVKDSALLGKGNKGGKVTSSLTESQRETAARLGFTGKKLKTYENIIKGRSPGASVTAE